MCSECGCRAETIIDSLMENHVAINARIRRIAETLDAGRPTAASALTPELAEVFAHHVAVEEAGLFTQLRVVQCGLPALDLLAEGHKRVVRDLLDAEVVDDPERLAGLLQELRDCVDTESSDIFPFALETLPNERWGFIDDVHQRLLTA